MPYRVTQRTEARGRENRERIVAAALRLVGHGGYQAAGMSDVAFEAGVGVGMVYRHFGSKSELIAEVFRRASQREVEAVASAAAAPGTAQARLAAAVETFARRALAGSRLAWALLAEPVDSQVEAERLIFRRAYAAIFAAILTEAVAAGQLPAQDVDVSAAALVGAVGEAMVGPLAPPPHQLDAETIVAGLVDFCRRSVGFRESVHGHR